MDPEGSGESCEHTPVRNNDKASCTTCTREFKLIPWPTDGLQRKPITAIALEDLVTESVKRIIGKDGWQLGLAGCQKESSEFFKCPKPEGCTILPEEKKNMNVAVKKDLNSLPVFKELFHDYWFEDDVIFEKIAYQLHGESCEHISRRKKDKACCTGCSREFKLIPWPKTGKDRKLITAIARKELITADVEEIIGKHGWKSGLASCGMVSSEFSKCERPKLWTDITPGQGEKMYAAVKNDLEKHESFRKLFQTYWFEDDVIFKNIAYRLHDAELRRKRKADGKQRKADEEQRKADEEQREAAEKQRRLDRSMWS